nr:MAG: hypothetical protein [Microvirus sp.]
MNEKTKNFNPGDALLEIHDAIIKTGEALNALTIVYNAYINGLNEAMAEIKLTEADEAELDEIAEALVSADEEDLNG